MKESSQVEVNGASIITIPEKKWIKAGFRNVKNEVCKNAYPNNKLRKLLSCVDDDEELASKKTKHPIPFENRIREDVL